MSRTILRGVTRAITSLAGLAALALAPSAQAAVVPIHFAAAAYYPTGESSDSPSADENGTATADLNGDGRLDVVAVDQWEQSTIVIQYGHGDGTFSTPGTKLTIGSGAPRVENVLTGVFTSSGRPDIVVLTAYGFYFLRNNGGGSFTESGLSSLEQAPFQDTAVAADLNGDGHLDLAIKTPQGVQSELGGGDGTFRAGPLTAIPGANMVAVTSLAAARVNHDQTPDLLASDASTQKVFALAGAGDGGFTETGSASAPFVPGSVLAVDDTGNGLDSAVALDEFNPPGQSAALLPADGAGGFQAAKRYDGGDNVSSGVSGDLNGDGVTDVVSSDTSGSQEVILAGDGHGNLVPEGRYPAGSFPQTPVIGDFNGDGKNDVAVTTFCPGSGTFQGETCLAVLLNNG